MRKCVFFVGRLKIVFVFVSVLIIGFVSSFFVYTAVRANADTKLNYTIVVDAGHGGIDGGCVGTHTGVTEAEINLAVSKKLKSLLDSFGFRVVMTRSNANGLYSQFATNKKLDDMESRKKIIQRSNADMVVSIHMNSFGDSSQHGAQTFYQIGVENAETLATCVQNELVKNMTEARGFANHTDLYILKCTDSPAIVVEGGFLTNPTDEELLITDDYQTKLAYSIFCGIVKFYEIQNQLSLGSK